MRAWPGAMIRTDLVALFEFQQDGDDIRIVTEKHYRLVPPDDVTDEDLMKYRQQFSDTTWRSNCGSVMLMTIPSGASCRAGRHRQARCL